MSKKCTRCQQVKDKFVNRAETKDGLSSWCSDCMADYNSKRQKTEAYRQRERELGTLNKRKQRQDKAVRQRQSEVEHEKLTRLRRDNPQGWRAFLDRINQRKQERRLTDPAFLIQERKYTHNRKAQKLQNGGDFTAQEWLDLCEFYGNRCLCCGEQVPLTIDHVIPLSKGGRNSIDNLQPLCLSCNNIKQDKTIDYR
jgi:5-methylcytosine-specific restriction endonuclease McrA